MGNVATNTFASPAPLLTLHILLRRTYVPARTHRAHLAEVDEEGAGGPIHAVVGIAGV